MKMGWRSGCVRFPRRANPAGSAGSSGSRMRCVLFSVLMAFSSAGAVHPARPAAGLPLPEGASQDTIFFVPLILGGSRLATGLALSNLGGAEAEIGFTAYAPDGIPLWGEVRWEGPAGIGPGALRPGEQRAVHVWEIFGLDPADEHQGWLSIRSSSASVRVVYQFVSDNVDQLDGMNALGEAAPRFVLPWLFHGSGVYRGWNARTLVSIVNPGEAAVTFFMALRKADGLEISRLDRTLGPRESLVGEVEDLFPAVDPNGARILVEAVSPAGAGLIGCELVTIEGGRSKALAVSNGLVAEQGMTRLYSAQAARVGGLETLIHLSNLESRPIRSSLALLDEAGEALGIRREVEVPALGYFEADLGDLFEAPDGTVGSLAVIAEVPGLTGGVFFSDPVQGYAAALPLQGEIRGSLVFPHVAYVKAGPNHAGLFTGLALHAPGDSGVAGTIEILDRNGAFPAAGVPFSLQPGTRISKRVSEMVSLPEQAGGYIRIRTNGEPLIAQELFGENHLTTLSAVPAFEDPGYDPLQVPVTGFIVVDQFGYRPEAQKFAVIRDPVTGFDAAESFEPGEIYDLVDARTGRIVLRGSPVVWNAGNEDPSSGDRAWWFEFSSVRDDGEYYVLDRRKNLRSPVFKISTDVYRDILRHAVRTFFYQRAGFPKEARFAGEAWADGASHLGPLQDRNCRLYSRPDDPSTEKDLHGGWYDAGDYNKYTNWTASYVIQLLRAFTEAPSAFTDDFGIPESGNGIPDLIDEVKWGVDWLTRMQNPDGSLLSIMGLSHASPPSAARGPSLYGSASTSATLSGAAAFAYAAKVFGSLGDPALDAFAAGLVQRAEQAWDWAEANPNQIFRNNDSSAGTGGLGAGQQETDDYGRLVKKLEAACYLFEVTGKNRYREFFDANYTRTHMMQWWFVYPFEQGIQDVLLYYGTIPGATPAVVENIRQVYETGMNGMDNLPGYRSGVDPYRAHIKDYTWGSNSTKSLQGMVFHSLWTYGFRQELAEEGRRAAEGYLHYLHGTNPLGLVYLSNMGAFGAEKSVSEFFHSWFTDGSPRWDRVGESLYGPAPGFLTGGPNPYYDWDGCCPSRCGSTANNAKCTAESIVPPKGQPAQKSYKDFNTGWPLNSWSVTENSCGYQSAYIRLLSKFVGEAVVAGANARTVP